TNRLQPDALIADSVCMGCDFNQPGKTCDRRMNWSWKGVYLPAKANEIGMIRNQLYSETFSSGPYKGPSRTWWELSETEQSAFLRKRVSEYSRKVYKRVHEIKVSERESIICQRENPFYINTVKAFRDRRYEYKGLHKTWKNIMTEGSHSADEAKK